MLRLEITIGRPVSTGHYFSSERNSTIGCLVPQVRHKTVIELSASAFRAEINKIACLSGQ